MKEKGEAAFDAWYADRFGSRWQGLRESLLADPVSSFYSEGLVKPYRMDQASVLAAMSLRLPAEGTVLDACAAPGGKSLVISSRMGPDLRLLSNELSAERRRRLSNVLGEYLDETRRRQVTVSGFDAAVLGGRKSEQARFAAILLDAPCSSERHVLKNGKALAQWSPARPGSLSRRQWALLSSCFLLLKPGASLVYSTCALGDEENDGVIARLFDKYGPHVLAEKLDFAEGEKTRYGRLILPDASGGIGPMYVARIIKPDLNCRNIAV